MKIRVIRDGTETLVDIDLDPGRFTMRELVRVEEALGEERTAKFMSGGTFVPTPRVMQALIWAKLLDVVPDAALDDMDVDMAQLEAWAGGELAIPQSVDGETEDVVVEGKADEDT
jgi:hypothetical protein